MPYRTPTALVLREAERGELEGWARQRRTAQALALRARTVSRSGDGLSNTGDRARARDRQAHGRPVARAVPVRPTTTQRPAARTPA
jgi:hypothetical protein